MAKVVTASEAVGHIQNNATIAINAMSSVGNPSELTYALAARYKEYHEPSGLTLWASTAQGASLPGLYADALGVECDGLLRKAVLGHWSSTPSLVKLAVQNKIAAYNLPQGIISHLYRAAGGGKPVVVSRVGLKTFVDPRLDGGRLNAQSKFEEDIVQLMSLDGVEYLQYKTPKIDIAIIRGTSADECGNISMEAEGAYIDAISMALAAKANKGLVLVQVEKTISGAHHPKSVKIPAALVDYIVVASDQWQTGVEKYNPAVSGDAVMPKAEIAEYLDMVLANSSGFSKRRFEHYVIAKRACDEVKSGSLINIGVGIPSLMPGILAQRENEGDVWMTNEVGLIGGVPLPSAGFGAALNPNAVIDMSYIFDLYDGGLLDSVFVGAAQIDRFGNVNVSRVGKHLIGLGGFLNLTQSTGNVVFVTTLVDSKDMKVDFVNGSLRINDGNYAKKFVTSVEQVSFSGELAVSENKSVKIVTERCIFEVTQKGLILSEVAPGIDIEKDIFEKMEFIPGVSGDLKIMNERYFC